MKVMRKYLKVVLCFMAFAVCSFLLAFSPTMTAYAGMEYAISNYNVAINSIKMPTKTVDVSAGDRLTIPLLDTSNLYNANFNKFKVRVVDPSGTNHDYIVNSDSSSDNDSNYFDDTNATASSNPSIDVKALNEGVYKIIYIVKDESTNRTYYSNTYEVDVKNVSYELDFTADNGLINLLPKNLGVNQKIELPIAKAVAEGSSAGVNVIPVVTQDGAPLTLNNSDFTEESGKYYLTTNCSDAENADTYTSVYTVEYTYGEGSNRPSKTFTINVSNKFVKPTDSDLELISTPSMPSVQLGQKDVTLPKLSFKDGVNTNIEYNVISIRIEKESDSSIYQELTNNNYTFDMTVSAFNGVDNYEDMVGNYRVTYRIKDVYGNETTEFFPILGVKITNKPTVYMSYDYEIDANKNLITNADDIIKDASADLKIKYGYSEVKVPAIYGYDQVSNYEDLILVRVLVNQNSKTRYYVDNLRYDEDQKKLVPVTDSETGYNFAKDANAGVNKAVSFKFTNDPSKEADFAGTYNLEYTVISKKVAERTGNLYISGETAYSITVLNESIAPALEAAKVEITNISNGSYIDSRDELSVQMTASHDVDTRLQKAVFYYYGEANNNLATDIATAIRNVQATAGYKNDKSVLDKDELLNQLSTYTGIGRYDSVNNNTYTLKFDNVQGPKVTIVAVALNDGGEVGVATKTLNLKNTADDNTAPTFEILTNANNLFDSSNTMIEKMKQFDQAVEVALPTVKFHDTGDEYLQTNVVYYIQPNGRELTNIEYKSPVGQVFNDNTISGARIITNEIGTYYVVYYAIDDAGNTSVVYFTFEVVDSSKPILTVDAVGDDLTQSGNVITAEVGAKINFKADLYSSDRNINYTESPDASISLVSVDFDGEVNNYYPSGDDKFSYIFKGVGTYTFKFLGSYNSRNSEEKTIVVNIKNPTVKWASDFDNIPEYANMNSEVYLPDVAATGDAIVSVSVTAPGGSNIEVKKVVNGNKTDWMFKTLENSKGTYVVKYSATSQYGSAETKTFNIKVGDNVAPTITMSNEGELAQEIVYDGTNQIEYTVNINKTNKTFEVVAKTNGNTIYSYNINMKIADKDDKGIVNSNYSWTNLKYELTTNDGSLADGDSTGEYIISGPGTYTLKLTIADNYDNETVKEISFKVVSEAKTEEKNDTVVGAVLIVISLIVLAGVILFFTLSGKKSSGTKAKKVKSSKNEVVSEVNEDKEDKIVVEEDVKAEAEESVEVGAESEIEDVKSESVSEVETKDNEEKSE